MVAWDLIGLTVIPQWTHHSKYKKNTCKSRSTNNSKVSSNSKNTSNLKTHQNTSLTNFHKKSSEKYTPLVGFELAAVGF